MSRFVRIYHDDADPPGSRIRVDYDPDLTGAFVIADEDVLPEHVQDPDARFVRPLANIAIDNNLAMWIRDTMIALCAHLEAKEIEARAAA